MTENNFNSRIERVFQRRYDLIEKLGSGGMGMVYLVRARDLSGNYFALKIVDKSSPENSGVNVYSEIQILKSLKHPNIVSVFEAIEDERYVYIIQEYIRGRTLAEIRDNPMSASVVDNDAVKLWMLDIADALMYLHAEGVVHRDIKPGNIMIDSDGAARLIDFGIARRVFTIRKTVSGNTVGSAPYSPLERLEGAADGIQTDIYAYGTTFYSLIRKRIPSISGREINTFRTSNKSIKPYYMSAYRTMVGDLENIRDDGIREIIRNCIDIDPRRRVNEFGSIRYMLSSMDEVQAEYELNTKESRRKYVLMSLLLVAGILLAGFGVVQMKRDHAHRYDKIIATADEAYAAGDYVESEKKADEAIEFDPNNEAGYFTKYKTITTRAYELNDKGEYERLIGIIENDVAEQPGIKDSLYTATYLANAYFETDRIDETISILSNREDLGDDQLLLLGHAMYLENDNNGAEKCLEKMTADLPQKHYLEGLVNEQSNQEEALACYAKVLSSETQDTYVGDLKRKALSQSVQIYRDRKQYDRAIELINVTTGKNAALKESIKLSQMLMDCYYDLPDYESAVEQANAVLSKFNSSHAYSVKTHSMVEMGDFDGALSTISDWKQAAPNDAMPHVQRAIIYNILAGKADTDAERKRTYPDFINAYEEEYEWLTAHNAVNDEFLRMEEPYYDAKEMLRQIESEDRR